ncbi:bifunctional 5,10-methylenetetrahydrofolate dehydrogenase/5,10-methenyltetrahydrofolate cyclohydrolase [Peptoniphilus sp. KCTC 25270]|uniref:bifunctional 5,10-methylenetetrahydrofolate dehydrogenase/5,10-methenyltetrahydrofolate cyclohydrolase n=1 Tax=Peptoniphilus sp. KCTC 25270 TaxID=2897414 RepID=UPI001E5B7B11|nr:bifunctional 5,10-methylenetetrahydrofolate dehydrogenase/5,10-methenyltetrahydrofolate cyclohydrolase [Peptoniphilus sp. KCTC 25270]MCD1147203.1 bifunctional 5,10-methylenetetrahydrofolate dehydrogenase/5,10-methenyltetrahydrofolate cyclohydrolase [Peptoniphilus sp. KCTC 25270]
MKSILELKETYIDELKKYFENSRETEIFSIVRLGENPGDLSYEKGLRKTAEEVGFSVETVALPLESSTERVIEEIQKLNSRKEVRGILVFRPLPKHIEEEKINDAIDPEKDVDCATKENQWKIFQGKEGIQPATALAALEIAKVLEGDLTGKHVVIVNRSMVIGKPLSMMLLKENATVTLAHSKSKNLPGLFQEADIVITGVGKAKFFTEEYAHKNLTVIDCGISFFNGKLSGDWDYEAVEKKVKKITPVPGGVGSITNGMILRNAIKKS